MAQSPDPLTKTAFIVDADKTPSSFFIRQWNLLLAFVKATVGDISALIAAVAALAAQIAQLLAVRITTTAPIGGGGPLLDLEPISHNDSGVATGTYGDSTHVAQVVVDAKGHVTNAVNVAISFPTPGASLAVAAIGYAGIVDTAQSSAFVGNAITPGVALTIAQLLVNFFSTVNGASYQAAVCSVNGSNVVQAVIGMSNVVVAVGTAQKDILFTFTPSLNLAVGTRYLILGGRVSAGDTVQAHAGASSVIGLYASLPAITDGGFYELPHAVPANGQTANFTGSAFRFTDALFYTL